MKIKCDGYSSNGIISILIRTSYGKTYNYEYMVDAALIPDWRERLLHHPHQHGAILKEIKRNATWYRKVR